jgi:hypothetical protein
VCSLGNIMTFLTVSDCSKKNACWLVVQDIASLKITKKSYTFVHVHVYAERL